jgi:prepilin-type N-terminal cleavage/methylation domain-containing protein
MNPRRAFTLIELLVVIAIIRSGMLSMIAGQHRSNLSTDFLFGHRFACLL